jgi:hypothetical protein
VVDGSELTPLSDILNASEYFSGYGYLARLGGKQQII